jgi:hypothetical protein
LNLEFLQVHRPDVYKAITDYYSCWNSKELELSLAELQKLPQDLVDLIFNIKTTPAEAPEVKEARERREKFDAEQAAIKQRSQDAVARLEQIADEQGLAKNPHNIAAITHYIDTNYAGEWTVANVEATVAALLDNTLQYAEELKPGQLSVYASKAEQDKATPDQLRDLLPRLRKLTGQIRRGDNQKKTNFGVKF